MRVETAFLWICRWKGYVRSSRASSGGLKTSISAATSSGLKTLRRYTKLRLFQSIGSDMPSEIGEVGGVEASST